MPLVSIGEFARQSRLSAKALRLYDESGLLPPARVDPGSGYRWYDTDQLPAARLVAALRQVGLPLARVRDLLAAEPADAAAELERYWALAEADHAARRQLARYLVDRLTGKRSPMYEVTTRQMPERSLLCLQRHVDEAGAWDLGREFVRLVRSRPLTRLPGRAGAIFAIYHGEVSADSDGPVQWCQPVPAAEAGVLAARFPELTRCDEPAHEEAFVPLGDPLGPPPSWELVWQAIRDWTEQHRRLPGQLGPRISYLATPPVTAESRPDCDFAVPLR